MFSDRDSQLSINDKQRWIQKNGLKDNFKRMMKKLTSEKNLKNWREKILNRGPISQHAQGWDLALRVVDAG